ncbi:MAG: YjbH domain-containing protein [Rhodobacteraceae bacterium]|nr:YjbH domain-containing protein [Paracoccaceae bacterium]
MFARIRVIAISTLTLGLAPMAFAQGFAPSFGNLGTTGIIDMPNAAMQPDGETSWSFFGNGAGSGGTLNFQILPNIEASARFISLDDWSAPGVSFADNALDIKFRLVNEGDIRPALAVGFRDFLSNGPTGSEYIVATKSIGQNLRVSAGVGWGRLGSYNPVGTPFGMRPPVDNTLGFEQMFAGDAALFGGVEWQTPLKALVLKAEYSSDNYSGEQVFGSFSRNSPFNLGAEYRIGERISLGAYYNYGSELGFRLSLSGNPNRPITAQDLGVGPAPVNARPADYSRDTSWAAVPVVRKKMMELLAEALAEDGLIVKQGRISGNRLDLYIDNTKYSRQPMAVGRLARILAGSTPPSIEVFSIVLMAGELPTTRIEINRADLEAQVDRPNAGPDSFAAASFSSAPFSIEGEDTWTPEAGRRFSWGLSPRIPVNLFSAGSIGEIDLLVAANAKYRVSRSFALNMSVTQKIIGNIGEGAAPSTSPLPHVRSNAALYDSSGPVVQRLTADYQFKLASSLYGRVSAGYLERMFGGVDAELLWKPSTRNWGLGANLSYVKQRDFDDILGFQTYETFTGFASLYWNTGWNDLEAQVDVGRYLAGDWGATFSLSRRFTNGWEVSGYMTLTDVSFTDFGDGNFDKGISLRIPFDWTLPFESRSATTLSLAGYGNDGGARLDVANRLYPAIRGNDTTDLYETWGAYWQ